MEQLPAELVEMVLGYAIETMMKKDIPASFKLMCFSQSTVNTYYRKFCQTPKTTTEIKISRLGTLMKFLTSIKEMYFDDVVTDDYFQILKVPIRDMPWTIMLDDPTIYMTQMPQHLVDYYCFDTLVLGNTYMDIGWALRNSTVIKRPVVVYDLGGKRDRNDVNWRNFEKLHHWCFGEDCGIFYLIEKIFY
jgi:hypothetical protein